MLVGNKQKRKTETKIHWSNRTWYFKNTKLVIWIAKLITMEKSWIGQDSEGVVKVGMTMRIVNEFKRNHRHVLLKNIMFKFIIQDSIYKHFL